MEPSRSDQLAAIRAFTRDRPQAVLFDEAGGTLFDVFGGKTLPLQLSDLRAVSTRTDKTNGRPYLVLSYGDGHEVALTDAGIAFAPDLRNAGSGTEVPPAASLRDYRMVLDRLKHELYGHLDREPDRNLVKLILVCVAMLDGARNIGFDVSREERELESHLLELEKRTPSKK